MSTKWPQVLILAVCLLTPKLASGQPLPTADEEVFGLIRNALVEVEAAFAEQELASSLDLTATCDTLVSSSALPRSELLTQIWLFPFQGMEALDQAVPWHALKDAFAISPEERYQEAMRYLSAPDWALTNSRRMVTLILQDLERQSSDSDPSVFIHLDRLLDDNCTECGEALIEYMLWRLPGEAMRLLVELYIEAPTEREELLTQVRLADGPSSETAGGLPTHLTSALALDNLSNREEWWARMFSVVVTPFGTDAGPALCGRLQADPHPRISGYCQSYLQLGEDFRNNVELTIAEHPEGSTAASGTTVFLSCDAEGIEPLRYRWAKDGKALPVVPRFSGVISSTLSIEDTSPSDSGSYACWVKNRIGKFKASNAAQVDIGDAPVITSHPSPVTQVAGTDAVLSCEASGTQPVGFHWQRPGFELIDDERLSGVATAELTIRSVGASDNGMYQCVATNNYGEAMSSLAEVRAGDAPTMTSNPSPRIAATGTTHTLSCSSSAPLRSTTSGSRTAACLRMAAVFLER